VQQSLRSTAPTGSGVGVGGGLGVVVGGVSLEESFPPQATRRMGVVNTPQRSSEDVRYLSFMED